jgi:hypothetical protein
MPEPGSTFTVNALPEAAHWQAEYRSRILPYELHLNALTQAIKESLPRDQ